MRRYVERTNRVRLHQPMFRARVLTAYQSRCAICRLGHAQLLDAAHIIPDGKPHGDPVVPNGLAMCKIHHAAFDHNILGVRPDLTVHIRQDILDEIDGPMLRHGLQGMHNHAVTAPRRTDAKPDSDRLEERYERVPRGLSHHCSVPLTWARLQKLTRPPRSPRSSSRLCQSARRWPLVVLVDREPYVETLVLTSLLLGSHPFRHRALRT